MRRPWDDWEIDAIRDIPRGDNSAVAREPRRSIPSVTSKRHRLGIGPRKAAWSAADDAAADRIVAERRRVEEAAQPLGRSRLAVYSRRNRRRAEGAAVPRAIVRRAWSTAEIDAVLNPGGRRIQDLAAALGRTRDQAYAVRRRQRAVHV